MMKRNRWLLIALLITNAGTLWSQDSSPGSLADEIKRLDARRMQAMVAGDLAALKEILADDLTYVHSSGRVETKIEFIEALKSGKVQYKSIDRDDVAVRVYRDAAVVTGRAQVGLKSDGQDRSFSLRFIDVYVRRGGRWQMVAWQSTRLQ